MKDLTKVSKITSPLRVERHWIAGQKQDLSVYRIPIEHLYFNIENGRYADRMIRLKNENPGVLIRPGEEKWKSAIEKMLAGEHRDTSRDKQAFDRLIEDIEAKDQLRPGVVLPDGGVIDGNRRLAALRRLSNISKNRDKFRYFDAAVLPTDTSAEDRWRIEAGLQLGISERWDYSPVNELLKISDGLKLYRNMIAQGQLPAGETAEAMVAKAIYGKTEADINEMASRLQLINEYLTFVEKPGQYDQIGTVSEVFIEARRIVTAAENWQREPKFIAKLKAALFYVIHKKQMDNWDLRHIYAALGGDPKKRGRKRAPNEEALNEFLSEFPDPRGIQQMLLGKAPPKSEKVQTAPKKTDRNKATKAAKTPAEKQKPIDPGKFEHDVAPAKERFLRKMEASAASKSIRSVASGALADLQTLQKLLSVKSHKSMTANDREETLDALRSIQQTAKICLGLLR